MKLEKKLKQTQKLRIESFNVMIDISLLYPVNIHALREISNTHSNYCVEYGLLINEKIKSRILYK